MSRWLQLFLAMSQLLCLLEISTSFDSNLDEFINLFDHTTPSNEQNQIVSFQSISLKDDDV